MNGMFVPSRIKNNIARIEECYNRVEFERLRYSVYQSGLEKCIFKDDEDRGQYFEVSFYYFNGFSGYNVLSDPFIKVEFDDELVATICLDNVNKLDLSYNKHHLDLSMLSSIPQLVLSNTRVSDVSMLDGVKFLYIKNTYVNESREELQKMLPNTKIIR